MEILNFLNGKPAPAVSGNTFTKLSPFDQSQLAVVAKSDAMDLVMALQGAKKALTAFEQWTLEQRADLLNKIALKLEEKSFEISHQEALYQGLPQKFVLESSVQPSIRLLKNTAESMLASVTADTSKKQVRSVGLVGIITSWNLSLKLVMERLTPALAAGNVMIVKVSEESPITAKLLMEVFNEAGMPEGLVSFLQGGDEVALAIAGHPSIRAVSFVGSMAAGDKILKAAQTQFKKVQLSMGVKNSNIVLGDVDFKTLMPQILRPMLMGAGQLCWNASRLFVLESVHKEFLAVAQEYINSLSPLKSPEGDSMWTPLISSARVEKTQERTQFGKSEHGKVIAGGEVLEGHFLKPTLMLDLPNCSEMQQDELGGPLFLVTAVKYQHEMAKWSNTSYYGHSAIVWGPEEKALKFAQKLEVGHVWINSWMDRDFETIHGSKQSSFGSQDFAWNGEFYSDVKKLTTST
jgi:NAD-dependent aldehyde dehydrogenases